MIDIVTSKAALRRTMRQRRRELPQPVREREALMTCAAVAEHILRTSTRAIGSYVATPDELDVSAFHRQCWQAGISVWVPRVTGVRQLSWHVLSSLDDEKWLMPGAYGIREPDPRFLPSHALPAGIPLVLPGLAFTSSGWRLGQGGGFYDAVLAIDQRLTIGVGFSCQLLADVPHDEHDQRVGMVVIAGQTHLIPPDTTA